MYFVEKKVGFIGFALLLHRSKGPTSPYRQFELNPLNHENEYACYSGTFRTIMPIVR